MANSEHVDIVRRGKGAIAELRKSHPGARLNLSGADFSAADLSDSDLSESDLSAAALGGTNLSGANLSGASFNAAYLGDANLSRANLSGSKLTMTFLCGADLSATKLIKADFSGADLSRANLSRANLSRANLTEADLSESNLSKSNLSGANLRRAKLSAANLSAADLSEANLSEANLSAANLSGANLLRSIFGFTSFLNVDLSTAMNLEHVVHRAPSSIAVDTLFQSRGKIPEAFLRGCGVPDIFITYLPSLLEIGVEFYSSFISYSHNDEKFAQRLHARMQQEHLRVWFAPEDIKGGEKIHDQIFGAIRVFDKLLLVLSKRSMNSEWVRTEIRRARKRERQEGRQVLFPIRLVSMNSISEWECFDADSGKDLAVEIREYHIPDFSKWKEHDAFEAAFKRLHRDLKQPREIP